MELADVNLAVPQKFSPMRQAIDRLQAEIIKLPQYEPKTQHYFAEGLYMRLVWSPAGSVIIGKVHKTEHLYAVLTGHAKVTKNNDVLDLNASRDGPQVLVCAIGTKRAVVVIEDAWRMNVHLNPDNITDIEELEKMLVEEDEASPFLPGNKLKQELLP
jgi:hypothetical protein